MDGARAQPLCRELRRRDGAGGEQEGQRRPLLRQRRHQRKNGVGLADACGVKPGEPPRRALDARLAQALVAPQRLLLAAPLAEAQQQRRNGARKAGRFPVGLEPQPRLGALGARTSRDGAAEIAARAVVGQLGGEVQVVLDLLPIPLELFRGRLARHMHDGADGKAQAGVGQVDLHPAPGVEREVSLGGDGDRQDPPAGLLRGHDDAEPGLARLSSRHVRRHRHRATVAQRLDRRPVGVAAAPVLVAAGGARAADQLHVETLQRLAQELGVGVPRQHDVGRLVGWLDERQQHELAMPHGDDARMMPDAVLDDRVHLRNAARGASHIADVAGERGPRHPVDQSCSLRNIRHAGQSWPAHEPTKVSGLALL